MPSTMVHVRVDERVKEEASATLAKMGISVSDAVRMLLIRIAEVRGEGPSFRGARSECQDGQGHAIRR
jgi:hypothetical protein